MEKFETTQTNRILNKKLKQIITNNKKGDKMRHKQLKLSAMLLLGLGLTGLQAQEAVPATGGNASGSGGTMSYSVGQVAYQTYTGTKGSVIEGVQQPYEISVVTGLEDAAGITLSVSAYPNPTTDYIILKVDASTTLSIQSISYRLFDINGKLLEIKKVNSSQTSIDMSNFLPATYFLKVTDEKIEVKTFKIIKN